MNQKEIEYRDQLIRHYLQQQNWDDSGEFSLKRKLIENSHQLLPDFPYIIDDEWEVESGRSDRGVGDLIFTDSQGNFAIVEVKWINNQATGKTASVKRTKKRRKVENQAIKYAQIYSTKDFVKTAYPYIFTNETDQPVLLSDVTHSI